MRRLPLVLAASVLLAACLDELQLPTTPQFSTTPSASVARQTTFDDEMVELGRSIPGFAGMHIDTNTGEMIVRLVADGPAARSRALTGARPVLDAYLTSRQRSEMVGRYKALPAYTFEQLKTWHDLLVVALPSEHVTMYDIDEVGNRVLIGVAGAEHVNVVQRAAAQLGAPSTAIHVEPRPAPDIEFFQFLRNAVSPRIGGLKIEYHSSWCTLGANLDRVIGLSPTVTDGHRYFLTNAHCGTFGVEESLVMGQPTLSNPIGVEFLDPPLFTSATNPACPPGRYCRYSDAAVFRYNPGITSTPATFAIATAPDWPYTGNPMILGKVTFSNQPPIFVGDNAAKTGARTGTTGGSVTETCFSQAQSAGGIDTFRTLLCQYRSSYISDSGDSGGPVFRIDDTHRHWLGIHWGNGGFFSRNIHILDEISDYVFPVPPFFTVIPW